MNWCSQPNYIEGGGLCHVAQVSAVAGTGNAAEAGAAEAGTVEAGDAQAGDAESGVPGASSVISLIAWWSVAWITKQYQTIQCTCKFII